tara:strand:+ start:258 stop:875 length:618 start_codon:yes stop_codon:yes gene_type:complete
MPNILNTISGVFNAANTGADQLTTAAKGILCLPSILKGGVGSAKSIIGGVLAGATQAINTLSSTIQTLVTSTISNQISKLTGAATSVINTVVGAIATIGATIELSKNFIKGIKSRTKDVLDFTKSKENCNFAAATLASCITNQALNSVTSKIVIDVSKGITPVNSIVSDVASSISSPAGAINNFINKQAAQINKADKIVKAASIF